MKFGLWYDFRNPQRQRWPDLYGELLDQIEWADSAGFESVWLSEHHVTDDGYMPSVFVMLAAIAGRTRKLRLGTAVCLAPLHHPIRLAEDVAVVDVLSGGRVELGLAPGYRPFEFDVLGVPRRERGVRTDETVEILRMAWTGESFSYSGRVFDLRDVVVQPVPLARLRTADSHRRIQPGSRGSGRAPRLQLHARRRHRHGPPQPVSRHAVRERIRF